MPNVEQHVIPEEQWLEALSKAMGYFDNMPVLGKYVSEATQVKGLIQLVVNSMLVKRQNQLDKEARAALAESERLAQVAPSSCSTTSCGNCTEEDEKAEMVTN